MLGKAFQWCVFTELYCDSIFDHSKKVKRNRHIKKKKKRIKRIKPIALATLMETHGLLFSLKHV